MATRLSSLCFRNSRPAVLSRRISAASPVFVASYHSHHSQKVRRLHASIPPEHHQHQQLQQLQSAPWPEGPAVAAAATAATTAVSNAVLGTPSVERPLAKLSLPVLLRSIMTQELMSRPTLMDLGAGMLKSNMQAFLANPLFRSALEQVFYTQFCAGRTKQEIARTVDGLKELGYRGVILMYAREIDVAAESIESDALHREHVAQWLDGNLQTISYVGDGDCVAIKYTGAGAGCVRALEANAEPDAVMKDALDRICQAAKAKGAKLLFDAEHYSQQRGIDSWTMKLMEKYNRDGELVVYNTYQMYLKESTATLAAHLALARSRNFALGVKLVRGAYINSDPRHLIHDTKADTDRGFNNAARMLATLHVTDPSAPRVGLVLASHNKESTDIIRELRREQIRQGLPLSDVVYAQLMGMADELSLGLTKNEIDEEACKVFKYVVWGSTEECVLYLLRRAEENRDAVERSALTRRALWEELRVRMRLGVGAQSA